jgi:hypothetical protein
MVSLRLNSDIDKNLKLKREEEEEGGNSFNK